MLSYSDWLDLPSTEELRETLEEYFEFLNVHNQINEDYDEFERVYLEQQYEAEYSDYLDRAYDSYKDDSLDE